MSKLPIHEATEDSRNNSLMLQVEDMEDYDKEIADQEALRKRLESEGKKAKRLPV